MKDIILANNNNEKKESILKTKILAILSLVRFHLKIS